MVGSRAESVQIGAVNAKQVGLEGISRYGKEALVTLAYDPRIAIAYVASSGAGGSRLLRRNFGQILENLAGPAEYHWLAGNFIKYGADPLHASDLPVDAHELIALCAPRPVLITCGTNTGPIRPQPASNSPSAMLLTPSQWEYSSPSGSNLDHGFWTT